MAASNENGIILFSVDRYKGTGFTSEEITSILALEAGVLVENGAHFVKDGEGYIRVNLGTQKNNVLEALRRVESIFSA